eukprot:5482373-Ditylum_brightwellii.AAC.1
MIATPISCNNDYNGCKKNSPTCCQYHQESTPLYSIYICQGSDEGLENYSKILDHQKARAHCIRQGHISRSHAIPSHQRFET